VTCVADPIARVKNAQTSILRVGQNAAFAVKVADHVPPSQGFDGSDPAIAQ